MENTNRKWVGNTLISFATHTEATTNRPPPLDHPLFRPHLLMHTVGSVMYL